MLWDIRARMKPALAVIDLIPNIHRTPALAALRRAVLEGRPATGPMSAEDRELAFHDAAVALTLVIWARGAEGALSGQISEAEDGVYQGAARA